MELNPSTLYDRIATLAAHEDATAQTLDAYLSTLVLSVPKFNERMPIAVFLRWLEAGIAAAPERADSASEGAVLAHTARAASAADRIRAVLRQQAADLRALRAAGTLDDSQCSFGVNAPSGHRWYNFDVASYLECGAAGTFGCMEDEDTPIAARTCDEVIAFLRSGQCYE